MPRHKRARGYRVGVTANATANPRSQMPEAEPTHGTRHNINNQHTLYRRLYRRTRDGERAMHTILKIFAIIEL